MLEDDPPFGEAVGRIGLRGLHVGSARKLKRGWLNSDLLHIKGGDGSTTELGRVARLDGDLYYLEHDSAQPFPLEDASFDWVYSEHFIEHLTIEEGTGWLTEVRRLLRPGGHVRLSTPDLRKYAEGYLDPEGSFFAEHRERLSGVRMFAETGVPDRRAWMMNQIFKLWTHKWIYDFEEIAYVAGLAGFSPGSLTECAYRQGRTPEVSELDLPGRNDESLYVEIVRE